MALTPSSMLPLGTKAPEFNLPDVISGKNKQYDDISGTKGTVVMFICAHCPYVIHVQDQIALLAKEYEPKGIGFVAISANDVDNYPADAPYQLKKQADEVGFDFPYLYDESQAVAKAYQAECTPDFFVFDENSACVYRGRMDEATPGNDQPNDGKDLRQALDMLIDSGEVMADQRPSMGCNIKWK